MNSLNILNNKKIEKEPLILKEELGMKFLVSVPHSGLLIPLKFLKNINLNNILESVDCFTDKIFHIPKSIFLKTELNKDFLNLNRSKKIIKKGPKHLKRGPLTSLNIEGKQVILKEYSKKEKKEIFWFYNKYHLLIKENLKTLKKINGFALMLEGHSLSSIGPKIAPDMGKTRADFVVGTLDDTSAHPEIINFFYKELKLKAEKQNLTVVKNQPYKGGFITQKYSDPKKKINVFQLEVNKKAYMDEKTFKPNPKKINILNRIISDTMLKTFEKCKEIYFN